MRSHIRFAIAAAVIAAPTYLLATPSFASAEDAAAEVGIGFERVAGDEPRRGNAMAGEQREDALGADHAELAL